MPKRPTTRRGRLMKQIGYSEDAFGPQTLMSQIGGLGERVLKLEAAMSHVGVSLECVVSALEESEHSRAKTPRVRVQAAIARLRRSIDTVTGGEG